MRKLILFCPLICLSFTASITSHFESYDPDVSDHILLFEGQDDRFPFILHDKVNSLSVCGLEQGASYTITVSQQFQKDEDTGLSITFQNTNTDDVAQSKHITFSAVDKCMEFWIHVANPPNTGVTPVWVSLFRTDHSGKVNDDKPEQGIVAGPEDPQTLIENVLIGGGCFSVENVTAIGHANSIGGFANGTTSIGVESGVILSTGDVAGCTGPNNSGSYGTNMGGGGDPDLAAISGQAIFDAAGIEFDFTPTINTVTFNFAFGSEEYCEWVGSGFNDAFGFFISGPGINGTQNLAVVPYTNVPVTINSINDNSNNNYFQGNSTTCIDNNNNNDIQFDGYTTIMTAIANVIPCEKYHIKLVVGDGSDAIYDSAVFLEANSFDAGGDAGIEASFPLTGTNIAYEGCGDALVTIIRENLDDLSMPLFINYQIDPASTATPGVDYSQLPNPIVIPANQTSVSIPLVIFEDFINEGVETIIITIENPCNCENSMAVLEIHEKPPILVNLEDNSICASELVVLSPTVSGGVGVLSYQWNTGETSPAITVMPQANVTYTVTVSDECGQSAVDSSTFFVTPNPTAEISGSGILCNGVPSVDYTVFFTGEAPWDFTYAINGIAQPPITGVTDNPYILTITEPGVVTIISVSSGVCTGPGSGIGTAVELNVELSTAPTNETCDSAANGIIDLNVDAGVSPFYYHWSTGSNVEDLNNVTAGVYTATVTDVNGCTAEITDSVGTDEGMEVEIIEQEPINCFGMSNGVLEATAANGTPTYTYTWNNGDSVEILSDLSPGTYSVTITDVDGCSGEAAVTLQEPDSIALQTTLISAANCINPTGGNIDLTASGGTPAFTYNWSNGSTDEDPSDLGPGMYTVVVTDSSGCTAEITQEVPGDFDYPTAAIDSADEVNCYLPLVTLLGDSSTTGSGITYSWTTSDGNIVSGGNTLNPQVDQGGTYQFVVSNSTNGCADTTSVLVAQDQQLPTSVIASPATLTCDVTSVIIDGSGSSTGNEFTYQWTTNGGQFVSSDTILSPEIDGAGRLYTGNHEYRQWMYRRCYYHCR